MATQCECFWKKIGVLQKNDKNRPKMPILKHNKKDFQKSNSVYHPCTRRHLSAKFDVLRPSQTRDIAWRKTVTNLPTPIISPSMNLH